MQDRPNTVTMKSVALVCGPLLPGMGSTPAGDMDGY